MRYAPLLLMLPLTGGGRAGGPPETGPAELASAHSMASEPQLQDAVGQVELPPGRVENFFRELRRLGNPPPEPPAPWPSWSDGSQTGWGGEAPWRAWVELLRAEARAEEPDARRRCSLALLACAQGRSSDAWPHLLAGGPSPLAEYVLPALLPGVPLDRLDRQGDLPPGVLLTPGLPPPHDAALDDGHVDTLSALAGRTMRAPSVTVGETRFEMRVIVEGDGVQVDLVHISGPEVALSVLLPVPGGVELDRVYRNWEKIGEGLFPIEVTVTPEPRRQTLWGRFRQRQDRWPAPGPSSPLTKGANGATGAAGSRSLATLMVVVPAERRSEPRLVRFTEALAELFERPARLATRAQAMGEALFEPTTIHLDDLAEGPHSGGEAQAVERKLLGILRMVEAHALSGSAAR